MKTSDKFQGKKSLIALALAGLALAPALQADEYHYRDILIGDRAAGLGGAFTAVADDASGLYYNPAGVVYTTNPRISGSVSAYNHRTIEYSSLTKDNPGQKWTRTSSGMVANYFGAMQPMGPGVAGFSIAVPNYDLEDQSEEFTNLTGSLRLSDLLNGTTAGRPTVENMQQNIDFNNEDRTTLVGFSYALPVTDTLSVGGTLYGYFRKRETTNWQHVRASGTNGTYYDETLYQKIQTEETGLQPRLGVMWSPMEKLSVGVMLQHTLILSQSPEERFYNTMTRIDTSDNIQTVSYDSSTDAFAAADTLAPSSLASSNLYAVADNDLPTEINVGVAFFPSSEWLYTADFSYATETDIYEATWNAAAGAEYFLSPTWAVRGGLFSNNANTPSKVSAASPRDHINMLGGAFSVSRYTPSSNITAGMNYSTGSGEANLFSSSSHVQDVTINSLSIYISASASF